MAVVLELGMEKLRGPVEPLGGSDTPWFSWSNFASAASSRSKSGMEGTGRSVGSSEAVAFGQREEVMARATLMEYDTQQGDYSIFNTNDGFTQYNSYNPINVFRGY